MAMQEYEERSGDDYVYGGEYLSSSNGHIHNYSSKKGAAGRGAMHATMMAAAVAVWLFCQKDHPSIHWKLVFVMFSPVRST